MRLLDPELLRTFLIFVETGSLARAAEIVGRSPSAVTAQIQRLEEAVGGPVLAPAGRGRVTTALGDHVAIHARRILDANQEAWLSLSGASASGNVVLGATQDFATSTMPDLLRAFVRNHPQVRLDLNVGRTAQLTKAFEEGDVDVLLVMRGERKADELAIVREPMLWLISKDGLVAGLKELPVALLDPPCGFRSALIAALDHAQRPYRIAATSGSLSGLVAAVRGGTAVTLRTRHLIGEGIVEAPPSLALPEVSEAEFAIRVRSDAGPAARSLAALLVEGLGALRG